MYNVLGDRNEHPFGRTSPNRVMVVPFMLTQGIYCTSHRRVFLHTCSAHIQRFISCRFASSQTAWVQAVAARWWDFSWPDLLVCTVHCRKQLVIPFYGPIFPYISRFTFPLSSGPCHMSAQQPLWVTIASTWLLVPQGDLPRLFVCITFVLKQSPPQSLSVIFNSATSLKDSLCGWKHSAVL